MQGLLEKPKSVSNIGGPDTEEARINHRFKPERYRTPYSQEPSLIVGQRPLL